MLSRLFVVAAATLAAAVVVAAPAGASELIDRNASSVTLRVDAAGRALLSYHARGRRWNVVAWNAVDAVAPTATRRQVAFRLDYSGGWGGFRKKLWLGFRNVCGAYSGPPLKWLVTACTAPDGSHWAVQAWQRMLPNYGLAPTPKHSVWELRLSHWTGEPAQLEVKLNWAYRRYDHMFGRFTYRGNPVFGFRSTSRGEPLDTFGRNLYVDTFDSTYGGGWKRENSFLMHNGSGAFCYGFYPHGPRQSGMGRKYRATIIGPGVTPDVYWEGTAPGTYDRGLDLLANDEIHTLGSSLCKPN